VKWKFLPIYGARLTVKYGFFWGILATTTQSVAGEHSTAQMLRR